MEARGNRVIGIAAVLAAAALWAPPAPAAAAVPIAETVVNSASSSGTTIALPAGEFTIEASGTYWDAWTKFPWSGRLADAECTHTDPDPTWNPYRWGAGALVLMGASPTEDPQDLYIDGDPVDWTPADGSPLCAADHIYRTPLTMAAAGTVTFSIYDPFFYADNSGSLSVKVFPQEAAAAQSQTLLIGVAMVEASKSSPTSSGVPLLAGQQYRIEATGAYIWDKKGTGRNADAECTRIEGDLNWSPHRFDAQFGEDMLDLYIAGGSVDWTPITDTGDGCNAADHAYELLYTEGKNLPVDFIVRSTCYGCMSGTIQVRIYLVQPPLPSP